MTQGAAPTEYLSAPPPMSQEIDDDLRMPSAARTLVRPTAPHDWSETLDRANAEIAHRSRSWAGLCQMFCRSMPGCPGGFASALIQWHGMPAEARHEGGSFEAAPIGSMLFSLGDNPHGHVQIRARDFTDAPGAISTDALRVGWPDRVDPVALTDSWGQRRLGWGENMNGMWLQTKGAKPVQDQPYVAIAAAVDRLGNALDDLRTARDTAKTAGDWKDRDALQAQIDVLRAEKNRLRKMYDTLRHA